ncbi:hypothetical protein LTR81_000069 [Elasticomyces elasticus]
MISLRRYAVFASAMALLLLLGGYFHEPIVSQAKYRFGKKIPLAAQPGDTPIEVTPVGPFRWDTVSTQYPIPTPLVQLPAGPAKKLPKVQFDFPREIAEHATKREERQAAVHRSFERCWQAYKQHAWGHDELAPLSGGARDGFGGWAASLVDNLDNLWIMGMKEEFSEAVEKAIAIDLGLSTTETINVFETTIRHLGGLLAAYDVSGDKRLLDKAKEFGEMLLKAFDTPNRLPITRWVLCLSWDDKKWRDEVKSRHSEKVDIDEAIKELRLPEGFTDIADRRYILRPEAIESVFILYRITGEQRYQDAAWDMFMAITNATTTQLANAALSDITYSPAELAQGTTGGTTQFDSMESFWMAETLKYFYLIFSEPDLISLDEFVFNTEAHPFKRMLPA